VTAIIPAEPPKQPSVVAPFSQNKIHKWGLVPKPLASTPPQNKGNPTNQSIIDQSVGILKKLKKLYIVCLSD